MDDTPLTAKFNHGLLLFDLCLSRASVTGFNPPPPRTEFSHRAVSSGDDGKTVSEGLSVWASYFRLRNKKPVFPRIPEHGAGPGGGESQELFQG